MVLGYEGCYDVVESLFNSQKPQNKFYLNFYVFIFIYFILNVSNHKSSFLNRKFFSSLHLKISLYILAFMLCYTQDDTNAEGGMYYKICFCSPTLTIFNYYTTYYYFFHFFLNFSFNFFLHLVFIFFLTIFMFIINLLIKISKNINHFYSKVVRYQTVSFFVFVR